MKIKYRDAKYLCKYDLDVNFFENINLKIKDLWPTRNIYVLDTEEGKKILKMTNYDEEKINFIVRMLEYIRKSYKNIITYHKFDDGKYYTEWRGKKYVVLNLIEGIECNMYNPRDIDKVTKGLANIHKASRGIFNEMTILERKKVSLGELEEKFKAEKDKLEVYKNNIEKKVFKNQFDEIFLEYFDYYMNKINCAIELIRKSNYKKLCNDEKAIALCHKDLAYHNILISNDDVYFIDFDFCDVDLKVLDIYSFLSKVLKKTAFDYDVYINVLDNYRRNISFTRDEEEILKILLIYPQDFYNIVDNYYLNKKQWSYESYLNKLKEKIGYLKETEVLISKIEF